MPLPYSRATPAIFLLLTTSVGCSRGQAEVLISFSPPVVVSVTALPYDPEALLTTLAAGLSKPTFPIMQLEIANYALPDVEGIDSVSAELEAYRDSVEEAADALFFIDRESPRYRTLYGQFRELYSRFVGVSRRNERITRSLLSQDRDLARRVEAAADSLRTWEENAYARLDSATAVLTGHAAVVSGRTDESGQATLTLPVGKWWITARLPHPANPFLEYSWNRRITISSWKINYRLPLSMKDALIRWRH